MKKKNSLFKLGLAVFLTAAAIIVFGSVISSNDDVFSVLGRVLTFVLSILAPFTVAFVVAYLLNPVVNLLERAFSRWKKPRARRATSIAIIYVSLLGIVIVFLGVGMPSIINNIADLLKQLPKYYTDAQQWVVETFQSTNFSETQIYDSIVHNTYDKNLALLIDWSTALQSTLETLAGMFSVLGTIFFSTLISVYMLFDKDNLLSFARRLLLALSKKRGQSILGFTHYCNEVFSSYVRGRLLDTLILGMIALIGFFIIGVPYAPLFCLIIIVTNLVPYIGPVIGAIPPVLIALLTKPIMAFYVILLLLLLQLLDTTIIGPHIYNSSMKIGAFWVMVGIILGGGLLGVVGVFIGVPLVAIAKAMLERFMKRRGHGIEDDKSVHDLPSSDASGNPLEPPGEANKT